MSSGDPVMWITVVSKMRLRLTLTMLSMMVYSDYYSNLMSIYADFNPMTVLT